MTPAREVEEAGIGKPTAAHRVEESLTFIDFRGITELKTKMASESSRLVKEL